MKSRVPTEGFGLWDFQHSAALFLLKCTGNVGFPYIESLAKAGILFYIVQTMDSTAEVE
jgi:hypothetical protein